MFRFKRFFKIFIVSAIVVITAFAFTGCGKKDNNSEENTETSYKQPIEDYFEGIKNKDVARIQSAFADFEEKEKSITQEDLDDMYEELENAYGANISIEYAIGESILLDEGDLDELKQNTTAIYTDIDSSKITSAYLVPITVTVTGDGLNENNNDSNTSSENESQNANAEETTDENTEQTEFHVIQYDGNWYML